MPESVQRRALITGAGGFLGSNLSLHLVRAGWNVWGTWHTLDAGPKPPAGVTLRHLDVCVPKAIQDLLDEAQPDTIFHLAALADPDTCAQDEPAARQINVQGTKTLALEARARGTRLVFLSTDQVFDGNRSMWSEADTPAPLGAYGRSKRDAEQAVREAGGPHLILRLALTYGWGRGTAKGRNFAEQWIRSFLTGNRVRAFTDQWRTPIYGGDACEALRLGAEQGWEGILHLAGPERVTRHDFGTRLAREFGFPLGSLLACELKDVVFRDPRPSDASLDTRKLRALGFSPLGPDEGLKAMHQELERL
ncbi:MAG: SDR family oxidoreductase [bacterium]